MKVWKDRLQTFFKTRKKEQILAILLTAAILLLVFWPTGSDSGTVQTPTEKDASVSVVTETETDERKNLENELKAMLEQVEGVGAVDVAITMESSGTRTVEKDVPSSQSSSAETDSGRKNSQTAEATEEQTVYLEQADGTKTPYVIRETMPEVRGVLVVAQGAGDPQVVSEIKEAVMALFHLDAHKIKVMKKK